MSGLQTILDPRLQSPEAQDFENALRQRVVGQDRAVRRLSHVFQVHKSGLVAPGRPIVNLLLLGPTGSGKTRVVEAVAETLFGDPRAVLKIDCAEFQHSHEISKLIGSPPGYLGHRETSPAITQEALEQHYTDDLKLSLVLFDEIEKASDALWQLLLGILDKATLTLGDNRRVDFSHSLVFLTSNLGSADIANQSLGEVTKRETVMAVVRATFKPEFLNRLDDIILFDALTTEELAEIVDLQVAALARRLAERRLTLHVTPAAREWLALTGFDPVYGARPLRRLVQSAIGDQLARSLLAGQIVDGDTVLVDLDTDADALTVTAERLPAATASG